MPTHSYLWFTAQEGHGLKFSQILVTSHEMQKCSPRVNSVSLSVALNALNVYSKYTSSNV